ncbi:MAG TPA: hypothetical protein PKD05_03810 [Candidatus Melainabacteria bacterium]|nr:hypothetical protein [Candidatus Melainabacteria bacterium]
MLKAILSRRTAFQALYLVLVANSFAFAPAYSEDAKPVEKVIGGTDSAKQSADRSEPAAEPQIGAYPNIVARGKDGLWIDLPRPDARWESEAGNKNRKILWNLSTEEQDKLLRSRIKSSSMMGTFYEFNNNLYVMREPFLMTTSVAASNVRLTTAHARDYCPTFAELFESMARQTKTSVKYDPTFLSKWIAIPPAMSLPYTLTLADGWRAEDRGMYVAYIPELQPVGMDVYMFGRYSGVSNAQIREFRKAKALLFAKFIDERARISQMKEVKVDGVDSLYFETESTKRPGNQWRQWSFIKNGQAFLIVSSIDGENADKLVPDVEAMVNSFHVVDSATSSPGI